MEGGAAERKRPSSRASICYAAECCIRDALSHSSAPAASHDAMTLPWVSLVVTLATNMSA